MPAEPSGSNIYVPQFTVSFLDNAGIDEDTLIRNVTGVDIDESLESPGLFRISLHEEFNTSTQKYLWLDNKKLAPGIRLGLFFGYAHNKKTPLVYGRLKAITPAFLSASLPSMDFECYDYSQDLQKTEAAYSARDVKYSDVAREIAELNGLKSDGVETTGITYAEVSRNKNEKDYTLLKRLSEKIGYEFFVRKDILYFRRPKDGETPDFSFEYGKSIISFSPRMATNILVNKVHVVGWNPKTKEKFSETAGISDITTGGGFSDMDRFIEKSQGQNVTVKLEGRVLHSAQDAKELAIAELKRRNNGLIQGTLEVTGNPALRPGMTIDIRNVGVRFSGQYYTTQARHSLGESGYKTTLEVRRCI